MGVLTTGNTYSTADQVTASNLNSTVNDATFQSAAVDNTSTQLSGGAIIVKDEGITQDKIAPDAVGTVELANDVVINTSGSITGAAGAFTTLSASSNITGNLTGNVTGDLTGNVTGGTGSFTTLSASGDVTFDTDTLKVDSSNNRVGIGTVTPGEALQVVGNVRIGDGAGVNDDLILKGSATVGPSSVGGSISAAIITTNAIPSAAGHVGIEVPSNDNDDGFYVATDPNQTGTADLLALKINALGKVGIGEADPLQQLHISGSLPKIQIQDSDGTNQYGQFYHSAGTTAILARDNTSDGTIVFQKDDGTTIDETMRIDTGGRVGIGTSTPTEQLDLSGDAIRIRTDQTPASATATGTAGTVCWDASYIYVCTATNTWKRVAISTW